LNREKLQQLSSERIGDAQALLGVSRWSGAYYLAGYSLECALKSCVLTHIDKTGIIFDDRKYAENCWTHDLAVLMRKANLVDERNMATAANSNLGKNWGIAKDWSELSRYRIFPQKGAEKLVTAINDDTDGVLQWVKNFW